VFRAPWEAQAFATAVHLHAQGVFSWLERQITWQPKSRMLDSEATWTAARSIIVTG
jgi:hypothetical protein